MTAREELESAQRLNLKINAKLRLRQRSSSFPAWMIPVCRLTCEEG